MRSNSVLFLAFVLLAVFLAALIPFAESSSRHHHHPHLHGRGDGERGGGGGGGRVLAAKRGAAAWPCCDNCGGCTKSIPPQCQCMDARPAGCHPACRSCVKSSLSVSPPVYQCMDRIPNFCQSRCTAAAAH
ncbi:Bowman-Birk type trypsin inhibitor-like [Oryza brachyantha]|uniref:Bowman-Birk type trypsin inhibitor-like n=1 Tax=Oryza brachyantha TaxID=4533 RepID=UPI001ADC6BB7|nr:Bowman-Birk type trypsin inhibitor-like [Oryza brachyantha]